jgi:hypothetical protein
LDLIATYLVLKLLLDFIRLAFKLFDSIEWDLKLNGPFKFKSKHYSPKPLWIHSQKLAQLVQPKANPCEHGPAQHPFSFFLSFSAPRNPQAAAQPSRPASQQRPFTSARGS